jgi:DNA invertase Pin-like site-specific DNA recombinase
MVFDGSTVDPIQMAIRDAMVAFLAATAQAQAEATKIAQRAGIDAARSDPRKYPGRRPSYSRDDVHIVTGLLAQGLGASAIAKQTGLSRQAVIRIHSDPVGVEQALLRWGL